jgi:hypothetical protein
MCVIDPSEMWTSLIVSGYAACGASCPRAAARDVAGGLFLHVGAVRVHCRPVQREVRDERAVQQRLPLHARGEAAHREHLRVGMRGLAHHHVAEVELEADRMECAAGGRPRCARRARGVSRRHAVGPSVFPRLGGRLGSSEQPANTTVIRRRSAPARPLPSPLQAIEPRRRMRLDARR